MAIAALSLLSLNIITVGGCDKQKKSIVAAPETCRDGYNYAIGQGETIYLLNSSYDSCDELYDLFDQNPTYRTEIKIKKVVGNIEPKKFNFDSLQPLDELYITCLEEFEGTSKINSIVYTVADYEITIPFDITLTYNSEYSFGPPVPKSYQSTYDIGMHHTGCDLLHYFKPEIFYLGYWIKNLSSDYSLVINSLETDNEYFEMANLEMAFMTGKVVSQDSFINYEYSEFSPVKLERSKVGAGVVFKFNLNRLSEKKGFLGADLFFNLTYNGDEYRVPFKVVVFEEGNDSWLGMSI